MIEVLKMLVGNWIVISCENRNSIPESNHDYSKISQDNSISSRKIKSKDYVYLTLMSVDTIKIWCLGNFQLPIITFFKI